MSPARAPIDHRGGKRTVSLKVEAPSVFSPLGNSLTELLSHPERVTQSPASRRAARDSTIAQRHLHTVHRVTQVLRRGRKARKRQGEGDGPRSRSAPGSRPGTADSEEAAAQEAKDGEAEDVAGEGERFSVSGRVRGWVGTRGAQALTRTAFCRRTGR